MALRRLLFAEGYRFRIHQQGLPGKPDIVFTRRKKAIFVNGCFWHSHSCRFGQVSPATNADFWIAKRRATIARDAKKTAELQALGWEVFTVWECEINDLEVHFRRISGFLGPPRLGSEKSTTDDMS